jgi:hypothetical protein
MRAREPAQTGWTGAVHAGGRLVRRAVASVVEETRRPSMVAGPCQCQEQRCGETPPTPGLTSLAR